MKTLHRYILFELTGPFIVSFSLLTFILFMRNMVFLFPKIAGKHLGWTVIAELIVLSLPFIVALVLPMAVLVGIIMSFGRLSADNEITAMKALGIPAHRLMLAPLGAAVVLMAAAIWFNDRVLPEANHRYKNLLIDIAYLKPTLKLREGVIMDEFGGMGILVNRIKEKKEKRNLSLTAPDQAELGEREPAGPAELFGIIITENPPSGPRKTIVADSGAIRMAPDNKDALLTLYHGEIQEVDPQRQQQFQRLFFTRHQLRLRDVGGMFDRGHSSSYRSDRELTLRMIRDRIAQWRLEADSLYRVARVLLDSLPAGDSASGDFEKALQSSGGKNFGRVLPRVEPAAAELPSGTLTSYLKSPKMRLIQTCREAGYTQQRIASLEVEFWKKFAIPFASLIFVLLGVPLGILSRRGGAGVSISISMGVFLVYWICLISGETLADRLLISPFWAMWTPNAIFLVVGFWLLIVQVRGNRSLALARGGIDFNPLKPLARLLRKKRGHAGEA
ncbi:MAG: hypothetical protein A2Z86_03795 [Candidatus Glassbacteria bacterium GWA2_58_10]|uniref:Lipopolysaccharide export system permease protein LptF n=1 Tax=Candidatus Glassbacteria bacterium GWA2_58_10 TaxID=1817865 RepID=A0A1F5YEI9_9BACT|nr:MAG: hypothetical protein A2Z86_03795 [Candidatus Glassbacteria bacterium GWA2_58_10]